MRNVAYRHGGAGNNWALGYQMAGSDPSKEGHHSSAAEGREASNEFLQTIIDGCLRREIEHCDEPAALCTIHSLAGGTGSGLGARLTEELSDVMADVTRLNIAIGPYHMGEVVVQHYNAVLSLSSLAQSSDGVLLFENETAQALCRQMSGIERPLLADVNRTIAGNLLPVFLPRCSLRTQAGQGKGEDRNGSGRQGQGQGQWQGQARRSGLLDDVIQLCGHPGYRFLDVKLTPQTSREAVLHTYDSYGTLFKTLAAMQMSGSASERLIASAFKHSSSAATSSPLGQGRGVGLGQGALKSAATSLCFHGDGGREAALDLVQQIMQMQVRPSSQSTAAPSPSLPSAPSSSSSRMSMSPPPLPRPQHQYHHLHQQQQPPFPLLAEYLASHSTLLGQTDQVTVQFSGGEQRVNGYHRSASLLSNSQAVLPLLQRSASKAEDLFLRGAYVHQYTSHGMELDDFVEAFRTLGAVIHNYSAL